MSWCGPAVRIARRTHVGHELIAAGMLILATRGKVKPLDYGELERWTHVGSERRTAFSVESGEPLDDHAGHPPAQRAIGPILGSASTANARRLQDHREAQAPIPAASVLLAGSPHASPSQASTPSRTATAAITSPAIGSAQLQPSRAFSTRPTSSTADR
jgi:hypothetical protein